MTDETQTKTQDTQGEDAQKTEKQLLMDRARKLNITFSNNISVDKLKAKIENVMEGRDQDDGDGEGDVPGEPSAATDQERAMTRQERVTAMRKRCMRLVRVRITNLNPQKKNLPGEIVTVANKYLGTVKKFIPFGEASDEGYHVPAVLLNQLRERRFLDLRTRRDRRTGVNKIEQRWVREFAIEELPPLTKEELEDLAKMQAAKGGLED